MIGKALIRDVDDVMTGRSLAKKGIFGKHTFNDKATRKRTLEVSVRKKRVNDLGRSFTLQPPLVRVYQCCRESINGAAHERRSRIVAECTL